MYDSYCIPVYKYHEALEEVFVCTVYIDPLTPLHTTPKKLKKNIHNT